MSYFATRRLGDVNLRVDEIDRSECFFHETCGLMIAFPESDLEASFLGNAPDTQDFDHLPFSV